MKPAHGTERRCAWQEAHQCLPHHQNCFAGFVIHCFALFHGPISFQRKTYARLPDASTSSRLEKKTVSLLVLLVDWRNRAVEDI